MLVACRFGRLLSIGATLSVALVTVVACDSVDPTEQFFDIGIVNDGGHALVVRQCSNAACTTFEDTTTVNPAPSSSGQSRIGRTKRAGPCLQRTVGASAACRSGSAIATKSYESPYRGRSGVQAPRFESKAWAGRTRSEAEQLRVRFEDLAQPNDQSSPPWAARRIVRNDMTAEVAPISMMTTPAMRWPEAICQIPSGMAQIPTATGK